MKQFQTNCYASTFYCLLMLITVFILAGKSSTAQVVPSKGKEFWFGFTKHPDAGTSSRRFEVFITSNINTSGTVSIPASGWSSTFNVNAFQTTSIIIPIATAEHTTSEVIENKGILIETLDTVSVFAISFQQYSADASLIFPTPSLGVRYRVASYKGLPSNYKSECLIVATEDNTQIKITPSTATALHPALIPFYVNLNRGQSYQVTASVYSNDLTGTLIEGTDSSGSCRPFAVFGGTDCAYIPSTCNACDILYEQMLPTNVWSQIYYAAPFNSATSYTIKVIADVNGTSFSINGNPPITLNAGQHYEQNNISNAICVVSNQPVSVVQYMEGITCSNAGDPAMLLLNGENQKINNVTFSTVNSTVINQHYVNVIIKTAHINQLTLDGSAVASSAFTSFPSCSGYSYAQLSLTQGSHTLDADSGFTAYIYGTGSAESYSYSAGSFNPRQPIEIDSMICANDTIVLFCDEYLSNPFWVHMDNPTDTLGFGDSLMLVQPILPGIYMVQGNEFVSQCTRNFYINVELPSQPALAITQSQDSVCSFETVQLDAAVNPPGNYIYNWYPPTGLSSTSIRNPVANPAFSSWYYVTVSTPAGCTPVVTDSIYIHVKNGNVTDEQLITSDNRICSGESVSLQYVLSTAIASDDLDPAIDSSMWSVLQNCTSSPLCAGLSGNALYFNGPGPRIAQLKPLNVSAGGKIIFDIKIANGVSPCDDADPGEDVVLEYSVNAGVTYAIIAVFNESFYPVPTTVNITIPPAAISPSTLFRWRQITHSGANNDNWILDNIVTGTPLPGLYNYTWTPSAGMTNPNAASTSATPLQTTQYYVTALDSVSGCSYEDSILIDVDLNFSLFTSADTVLCQPAPIQLSATPDIPGQYTWSWSPSFGLSGNNTSSVTASPGQNMQYAVLVTSLNGCTQTDSIYVKFRNYQFNAIPDLTTYCSTDSIQGGVQFIPSCNLTDAVCSSPTGYRISNSGNISTNSNIVPFAGNWLSSKKQYLIRKQEINAAGFNQPGVIKSISFFVTSGIVTYNNLTINIGCTPVSNHTTNFITGLVTAYLPKTYTLVTGTNTLLFDEAYEWDGIQNIVVEICYTNINAGINSMMQVSNTTFTATLSDISTGNSCSASTGNTQFSRPDIQLNFCPSPSPSDLIYQWTPSALTSNPNIADPLLFADTVNYFVQITDTVSGCIYNDSIIVTNIFVTPELDLGNDTTLCDDEVVILNGGQWASYLWSNNATSATIQPLLTGNYSVMVTDTNGCQKTDSIQITFITAPIVQLGNDTTVCINMPVNLDAGNTGNSYIWSNGSSTQTITVNQPGQYIVSVDNGACIVSDTISINNFITTPPQLGNDTLICSGNSITLSAINYSSYLWSDNTSQSSVSVSSPGMYWLHVTDANNCFSGDTIAVDTLPLPYFTLGTDQDLCSGFTLQLTYPGVHAISWNTGQNTSSITTDSSGIYIATATDPEGCIFRDTINVTVRPIPVFDLGNDIYTCEGDSIILDTGIPAMNYLWSDGTTTSSINIVSSGIYSATATSQYNCTYSDSIRLFFRSNPVISMMPDTVACYGDSIYLHATSTGTVNWVWSPASDLSNPAASATNALILSDQTYTALVTDTLGCISSASVNVTVQFLPQFSLTQDTSFCINESIQWVIPSVYSCLWNDGSANNIYTASGTGIYWVDVTNNCGTLRDTLTISNIYDLPVIELGSGGLICTDPEIILDAGNPGSEYLWNTGETTQWISIGEAGYYTATVTNIYQCVNEAGIYIQPVRPIQFTTEDLMFLCPGNPIVLDATSDFADYLWNDANPSPVFSITDPGIYWYSITNICGTISDSLEVEYSDCVCKLYIPSAFTPNKDGVNEVFLPLTECNLLNYNMNIYNRWGQLIFSTDKISQGWDGKVNGNDASENVFFYEVTYKGEMHGEVSKKNLTGMITLVR